MVGVSRFSYWIANLGQHTNRDDKHTERKLDKRRRKAAKQHEKNHRLNTANRPQPMTGNH
ncbi:hypothetical protein ACRAJ3_25230 [Rhodococcus pyridinivorans]|uniref:hypothetical protein n=1 Tax=Rhodococcus pyridinivorans TaxID=103816 RepID=UPI003D7FA749